MPMPFLPLKTLFAGVQRMRWDQYNKYYVLSVYFKTHFGVGIGEINPFLDIVYDVGDFNAILFQFTIASKRTQQIINLFSVG